jgi:type IX secretion system PorP/SprF family membrane protein
MKNLLAFSLLISGLALHAVLEAQDLRFSQYYAAPHLSNPAFTGYFNGDVRAMAIYKSQWERPFDAYRTIGGGADFSLMRNKLRGSGFGVGLHAFSDQAGDINFNTNQIHLSMAYTQKLSDVTPSYLSAGFQMMTANRSIDLSRAIFDNQNGGNPGFDNISVDNYWYFSLGLGLLWYYQPSKDVNFYIGASAFNLLRPSQTFFTDGRDELFVRYVAQGGLQFKVNDRLSANPSLLFQRQGPFQELLFGTLMNYDFSDAGQEFKLGFGMWYRLQDALIPVVRVNYQDLILTFNYDINLSSLTRGSRADGGPEISLTYSGWWSADRKKKANQKNLYQCPDM